jgi:hypothetical protein
VGSCPTVAVTVGGSAVAGVDAVVDGGGGLDVAPTLFVSVVAAGFVSVVAGVPPAQFRRAAIAPVRSADGTGWWTDVLGICLKKEAVAAILRAAGLLAARAVGGSCTRNNGKRMFG